VPSEEGPHRKYYGLNKSGRELLDDATKQWFAFTAAMNDLLGSRGEEAA
jgi:PadR family transcriptional regulator, regulatory protein PadR